MSDTAFHQYAIAYNHDHRGTTIPDYHPLMKQEIAELLQHAQEAWQRNDDRTISSIHHRLCQGVVGQQCPRPTKGPVMKAEAKLGAIFVEQRGHYTNFDLVDALYAIMQHQE